MGALFNVLRFAPAASARARLDAPRSAGGRGGFDPLAPLVGMRALGGGGVILITSAEQAKGEQQAKDKQRFFHRNAPL